MFRKKVVIMDNKIDLISEELVKLLMDKKMTISTAESCTGGMISSSIVNISGASYVLNEAYVTYSNEAKMRLLGVEKKTLDEFGAVSEETASQMVTGVARITGADCAISVTGIAGPDGGTEEKPVGTVYVGYYFNGYTKIEKYNFAGDRYNVRRSTTKTVLSKMLELINNSQ